MTCYNDSDKSKKYQKHQNEAENLHGNTNNHSNIIMMTMARNLMIKITKIV